MPRFSSRCIVDLINNQLSVCAIKAINLDLFITRRKLLQDWNYAIFILLAIFF